MNNLFISQNGLGGTKDPFYTGPIKLDDYIPTKIINTGNDCYHGAASVNMEYSIYAGRSAYDEIGKPSLGLDSQIGYLYDEGWYADVPEGSEGWTTYGSFQIEPIQIPLSVWIDGWIDIPLIPDGEGEYHNWYIATADLVAEIYFGDHLLRRTTIFENETIGGKYNITSSFDNAIYADTDETEDFKAWNPVDKLHLSLTFTIHDWFITA